MSTGGQLEKVERDSLHTVRTLAEQAFSRAAGAPLIEGNRVRLRHYRCEALRLPRAQRYHRRWTERAADEAARLVLLR